MPDNEYIKLTATVVTISSIFSSYYDDHLINILAYIIHIIMYYYIYKYHYFYYYSFCFVFSVKLFV